MNVTGKVHTRLLVAIASACLLAGCSEEVQESTEIGPVDVDLDAVLATISQDEIQASLDYLAADEREGRMTGSRGYDESAQFVADQ